MREWLSGRASPCQGERREFESRFPLHNRRYSQAVRPRSAKPLRPGSNPGGASKKFDKFRRVEFFIHCESNGISSRFSVYLITEGAYHQPQAVSSFAMMIYNAPHWWYAIPTELMISTAMPWFCVWVRILIATLEKYLFRSLFSSRKAWYGITACRVWNCR